MATQGGYTQFTSIGKGIYLSSPKARIPESFNEGAAPTIILIFGWMGAKLHHLHKYTAVYERLYPEATKVLIECNPSFFWNRESTNRANLGPVVEVFEALGYIPPSHDKISNTSMAHLCQPRILAHVMSNGGCAQLVCLGRIIRSRLPKLGSPYLPVASAIIFDSCPGFGGLNSFKRVFTGDIRNPFIRTIGNIIITMIYLYMVLMGRLFGKKSFIEELRAALINPRLLPWTSEDTLRLYIYSKKDQLVPYKAVEEHIEEVQAAGLDVSLEKFEDTAHVAHARGDPDRYWNAIEKLWSDAHKREGASLIQDNNST